MSLHRSTLRLLLSLIPILCLSPASIAAQPRDLESILKEEGSVLDALDRAVFEGRRAETAMRQAEEAGAEAQARLAIAQAELSVSASRADEARRRLLATLRLGAAARPFGIAATLLAGMNVDEGVRRQAMLARLATRQAKDLATLVRASEAAEVAEFKAVIERANTAVMAQVAASARARLASEVESRRTLLAALEKDRALEQRRSNEMAASQRDLVRAIEARLSREAAPVQFESLKGKVRWPLVGARVAVPFGDVVHPVFRTVTPHPGLTLAFDGGRVRNVRAVAFGRVVWAGRMRGYGSTVVLDHASGYYTIYAGLSEILVEEGDIVAEFAIVGQVDREPGAADVRMYFELRKGEEPLDPAGFLAGAK
jgi:murein DD-endopeptidase MepM/ murein hydrolase activator NlpD